MKCSYHSTFDQQMCNGFLVTVYVQVSLDITCEEGPVLNYYGGSIEGISAELKQNGNGLQLQLEVMSATVMDSSINDEG